MAEWRVEEQPGPGAFSHSHGSHGRCWSRGPAESGLHFKKTLPRAEGEQTEGDGPGGGGWRMVLAEHGLTEGQEKRQR